MPNKGEIIPIAKYSGTMDKKAEEIEVNGLLKLGKTKKIIGDHGISIELSPEKEGQFFLSFKIDTREKESQEEEDRKNKQINTAEENNITVAISPENDLSRQQLAYIFKKINNLNKEQFESNPNINALLSELIDDIKKEFNRQEQRLIKKFLFPAPEETAYFYLRNTLVECTRKITEENREGKSLKKEGFLFTVPILKKLGELKKWAKDKGVKDNIFFLPVLEGEYYSERLIDEINKVMVELKEELLKFINSDKKEFNHPAVVAKRLEDSIKKASGKMPVNKMSKFEVLK